MGILQVFGAAIVGLVTVQLVLVLYGWFDRRRQAAEQQRLALELLQQRISAANALRVRREQAHLFWNGNRKFVVDRKTPEADDMCSFYLVPHDRKPLPLFQPGQYLTFHMNLPGRDKPVVRCYSLSDGPCADYYRVTIKRSLPPPEQPDLPPGLISAHFLDHVQEGDILDVQAPRGHFTLDPADRRPVVMIGGGVGVTPFLSMLDAIVEHGSDREAWLFYGIRNSREHAMKDYLDSIDRQHENISILPCYSQPLPTDAAGRDYRYAERVSVPLLQAVLGSNNYDFYICGPPGMMSTLLDDLAEWGVPQERIFSEAFGPASGKALRRSSERQEPAAAAAPAARRHTVQFSRSGKSAAWNGNATNLLEFAQAQGVSIDSGCRAGSCGSCLVAIKSGRVRLLVEADAEPEEGSCLTCISAPAEDLVLDA